MRTDIGIKAMKTYVAGRRIKVKELPGYNKLPAEEAAYYESCGVEYIHMAEKHSGYDLAKEAAQELLCESSIEAGELDYIIYIRTRIPEHFISSEAARLQYELGAGKAMTFAISDLGCTDSSMAIKLAHDFLNSNLDAHNVLICYGHKQTSDHRFRFPVTIHGDGGMALLIGRTTQNRIRGLHLESNGSYWNLFQMKYKDTPSSEYKEDCLDVRKYGFELALESRQRYKRITKQLLSSQSDGAGGSNHVLLQNISIRAYEYYEEALGVKISPVCRQNLYSFGHLGCADIIANMSKGVESGLFKNRDKVMVLNNSPVAAWSAILFEI